ncbi:MAG: hypothetical protein D6824_05380 [Planctomycetota bacterium]|nr:MAG: hypothetical protein D6824_05380 [Planctomycetota bacterium]
MQLDLLASLAQFGAAGLIGFMWLTERRHAQRRDQQLTEAHERLLEQRLQLEQLIRVVGDNTRALTRVEEAQRAVVEAMAQLRKVSAPPFPASGAQAASPSSRGAA